MANATAVRAQSNPSVSTTHKAKRRPKLGWRNKSKGVTKNKKQREKSAAAQAQAAARAETLASAGGAVGWAREPAGEGRRDKVS